MAKNDGKKVKEAVAEKDEQTSRYIGVTSGLRVAEFQNKTIADNPKAKLTDEELAAKWRKEFPKAKAFDAATVRTVRNLFNRGKHKNDEPAKPVHEYDDSGTALPLRGEKSAERKEAKGDKSEKAEVKGGKVKVFKKVKKAAA